MLDSDTTDLNWRRIPVNRIITVDVLWYILALSYPSNQKSTFSSNFKTLKHLGPSLCFKQLFHLKAEWSKCEHIESMNRAKATRALNPCLCSIVIYITCHQQVTTSRNPAIEERKRHLLSFASCPWTWSWTQQHTTKRLPGERQVPPSSICSPHMAKASMQAWKRRRKGATVTTCHDQSHFNIRPCPPHYQARVPAQWCRTWMVKKLRWTVGSWKSTSQAEVRAYAIAPAVFHFIYFMYHGCQVQYFLEKDGKGILEDHSIARCTQVWRNKNAATGKSSVYGDKDSVLHVFTLYWRVLIYHVFDHFLFPCANVCEHFERRPFLNLQKLPCLHVIWW